MGKECCGLWGERNRVVSEYRMDRREVGGGGRGPFNEACDVAVDYGFSEDTASLLTKVGYC